jgi:hypothetical protein
MSVKIFPTLRLFNIVLKIDGVEVTDNTGVPSLDLDPESFKANLLCDEFYSERFIPAKDQKKARQELMNLDTKRQRDEKV